MRKSKGNSEAFFPDGGAPRRQLPGSWAASQRLTLSALPWRALSPAASGAVCQWQTSSTDRRGSGDRALNGAHWAPAPPKGGGETWLPLRGRYVPVGRCPAADRGGSRDAGAVRRLRGPAAGSPPSPWEATFSVRYRPGKAQATKGCQAVSLASFQAAASVKRWTVPTGHQRPPPPLKRWTKLLPAYGAHASWPLDEHERSELPKARIDSPGTGRSYYKTPPAQTQAAGGDFPPPLGKRRKNPGPSPQDRPGFFLQIQLKPNTFWLSQ